MGRGAEVLWAAAHPYHYTARTNNEHGAIKRI